MEKHPLHIKIPEFQKTDEIQESVEKQERLNRRALQDAQELELETGEKIDPELFDIRIPNDPTERTTNYDNSEISCEYIQLGAGSGPNDLESVWCGDKKAEATGTLYSNSKYNFQFRYPSNLKLSEYPGPQECTKSSDPAAATNTPMSAGIASVGSASFVVVCTALNLDIGNKNLDPSLFEKHEKISKITVAGKDSYKHVFTTATGYSWVVYQIPLDSNHYVEISESNGNSDRMRGDWPLTAVEWDTILSSFK